MGDSFGEYIMVDLNKAPDRMYFFSCISTQKRFSPKVRNIQVRPTKTQISL